MSTSTTLLRVPELILAIKPLISIPITSRGIFQLIGSGDIKPHGFIQQVPVFDVTQISDIAKTIQALDKSESKDTEPVKDRYLSLKALAEKLELPGDYLGELAKAGAIPYQIINNKMVFEVVKVVHSLVRLRPKDKDISKVLCLYEVYRNIYNVTKNKK